MPGDKESGGSAGGGVTLGGAPPLPGLAGRQTMHDLAKDKFDDGAAAVINEVCLMLIAAIGAGLTLWLVCWLLNR